MLHDKAVELLKPAFESQSAPVVWLDLGCGEGTFTKALCDIIPDGSVIYAVDNNRAALSKLPTAWHDVAIHKINADFIIDPLEPPLADGILMANAFHYVVDKPALIRKLVKLMKPGAAFLIVEYETDRANPWVPYPIDFEAVQLLFREHGFHNVRKIGDAPSVYRSGGMYAASIRQ